MNDSELIWEAYTSSHQEILDESVLSTIMEISRDLLGRLKKGGLRKEDFVYYLGLIKSRSESTYNRLIKGIKSFITDGVVHDEQFGKIIEILVLILMNLVALPTALLTVKILQTPIDNVIQYVLDHKDAMMTFVNEITSAVEKLGSSM
jgi:hypothetical protein